MRKYSLLAVGALLGMSSAVALADITPGAGGTDPVLLEGVVNTGFGTTTAGDVVICENGATCVYSLSNTAGWSDMLVFYNPSKGPFTNDSSIDATDAVLFSDDESGFYSLSNFLANTTGLSPNGLVGATESATGNWSYSSGLYSGNSPEVPEPTSIVLLGTVLLGVAYRQRRKFARN